MTVVQRSVAHKMTAMFNKFDIEHALCGSLVSETDGEGSDVDFIWNTNPDMLEYAKNEGIHIQNISRTNNNEHGHWLWIEGIRADLYDAIYDIEKRSLHRKVLKDDILVQTPEDALLMRMFYIVPVRHQAPTKLPIDKYLKCHGCGKDLNAVKKLLMTPSLDMEYIRKYCDDFMCQILDHCLREK